MAISDEFIQLIAKAYYEAVLANINMWTAAKALESFRTAVAEEKNNFKCLYAINHQIGQADENRFQSVLITLRDRYEHQILESEIVRLHKAFRNNQENGWTEWLKTYAEALTYFRIKFCLALSEEHFLFPLGAVHILKKIHRSTKYVQHDRWPEAYDLFIYLAELECIPIELRAEMYAIAANIQIYNLLKPDAAKDLLHRGEQLAPNKSEVLCGWGDYWLQRNEFDKAKK